MGYSVTFDGELVVAPALTEDHRDEIDHWLVRHSDCGWRVYGMSNVLYHGPAMYDYDYLYWLEAMITECFIPLGYVLNGEVEWCGAWAVNMGTIYVKDNIVEAVDHIIFKPRPSWEQREWEQQS